MTPDPILVLSTSRLHELQDEARRHALARIATCCRPSAVRATLARLAARRRAAACCA